jgi:carbon monoxide dehydrogenase subunit G
MGRIVFILNKGGRGMKRSLIIFFVCFLTLSFFSFFNGYGESAEKLKFRLDKKIEVPIEKAWAVLKDFKELAKWLPGIENIAYEGEGIGMVRAVKFIGRDIPAREKLIALDDKNYSTTYGAAGGEDGFYYNKDFVSTIKLIKENDNTTLVEWTASYYLKGDYTEEWVDKRMKGFYSLLLNLIEKSYKEKLGMHKLFVTKKIAVPFDNAWKILSDFGELPKWLDNVEKIELEGKGVGMIRSVKFAGREVPAREKLIALDDKNFSTTYGAAGGNDGITYMSNFNSTIKLIKAGENDTIVNWTAGVDPGQGTTVEWINNRLIGFYSDLLDKIEKGYREKK